MSADTPVLDLGYRKRTHVIAAIKGERRRNAIRNAFDADRVSPLDELFATPTLPDEHRLALGRLHRSFMGGEYLPDRRDTEMEIARINIDSTTSDVTSVYARPGKGRIYYRVVDEYWGDSLTEKRTRSSRRPLSLGELIEFFLAAWPLREVLKDNELDRDGAQDFTRPSSEFYPQFAAAIRARIDGWYAEGDE
jgi:hypothetical protein